jgi:hypothetical protein
VDNPESGSYPIAMSCFGGNAADPGKIIDAKTKPKNVFERTILGNC